MTTERDIRDTGLYREAAAVLSRLRGVGGNRLSDASELHVSTDGRWAVFSGTLVDSLEGAPTTRICEVDLGTGEVRILTQGPNSDRSPKISPDGRTVAFLSDHHRAGDFQLHLLDRQSGAVSPAPRLNGWGEYLHWSADGRRILVAIAGHGADNAGGFGAMTSERQETVLPSWVPQVDTGAAEYQWRSAWSYDVATHSAQQINRRGTNVWEAVWCGPEAIAAIVSPAPGEGLWYSATLVRIDLRTGEERLLRKSRDQLGWVSATPSGDLVSVVDAVCSDRWIVAGELLVIDTRTGETQHVDSEGVDVSCAQWRSERALAYAGHRGFDSVVGVYDAGRRKVSEKWEGRELTTGGRYISVAWIGSEGDCALVGEGFDRSPELATVTGGRYRGLASLDRGYAAEIAALARVSTVSWRAPDGLEISGWLMTPKGEGPHALVMEIHGGPVWQWRPRWLARDGLHALMLLRHGYALFWPNPRGSAGQGRDFARRVQGDMAGADTHDFLSGLDHLVARGIADPRRLGVTGRSYGGYMSCWLITQDTRFAAAVPLAPTTDRISAYLTSNIPQFTALFLQERYGDPAGRYLERSPVMHARKARTPTMVVCGALDRCTPPGQALEFHNALLDAGVESVLVTYPEEGHGNRGFPAVIDYAARVAGWFERHMPAGPR